MGPRGELIGPTLRTAATLIPVMTEAGEGHPGERGKNTINIVIFLRVRKYELFLRGDFPETLDEDSDFGRLQQFL